MTILADVQPHAWGFMVAEPAGEYSREAITVLAGSGATRPLTAGMVLGKRITGTAVATADAGNTAGAGAMGAITVTGAAKRGRHRLVILEPASNAGTFVIFDPDGIPGPKGQVASAYSALGLAFTLADATDYAAGDAFTIDVQVSAEKWVQLDLAATTGEAIAAGILGADVTAPDGADAVGAALVRGPAIVHGSEITWPAGISAANKANALLELSRLGIIART